MDSPHSDNEQQQRTPTPKADATQQPVDRAALSPGETAKRPSDAGAAPVQASDSNAASAITAKLAKLEEHLRSIGKALTLHMGKEEVLTRSLVDLESKIKKIERSLQETVHAKAATPVTVQKMEREPDYDSESQGTVADAKQQAQQSKMSSYTSRSKGDQAEQWESSQDFFSPGLTDHEETSSFISESPDVFEASPDSENQMLNDDRFIRSGGEGRKPFLIIIPVLCLLALFLFLVFYYNDLQKQSDKKLTITEQISISSIPAATVTSQPAPPTGAAQQAEPKPALSDTPAPSPVSIPAAETIDDLTSSIPPHENVSQGGFAVAVGSFKEKTNAIALTSKLTNKGYQAQMALAKPNKLFRVTVGTFESRKEAVVMASQLQKKEQLKTTIVDLNKP